MDILRPTRRAALVAMLVSASLLAPLAGAQSKTARPDAVELSLALAEDGTATAEVRQTWTGPAARSFRQSLDVYFGAGDGILTEEELQNIANATQADMENAPLPWLSSAGAAWTITSPLVSFEGAAGRVSATGDVTMRHEMRLSTGQPSLPEQVDIDAPWNATLQVSLPSGKLIPGGGAPPTISGDERTSLRIVDASSPEAAAPAAPAPGGAPAVATPDSAAANATAGLDAGAPGGPESAAQAGGPNKVVIGIVVGLVLVLSALGVGAYYTLVRKGAPGRRKRTDA